jgi:hypothetical protein
MKRSDLYNLEEGIEEDTTPFITSVKLEEALEILPQLEEIGKTSKKNEEPSAVRIVESFEILERDKKGSIRRQTVIPKAFIHEEKLKKIAKNNYLIHVCNINRGKIYYNVIEHEFWLCVLRPVWIKHKRTMQIVSWIKLEEHDIESLLAFCLCYIRDFENPIPKTLWVRNKTRKKMEKVLNEFRI